MTKKNLVLPFTFFVLLGFGYMLWKTKPASSQHLIANCHILDLDGKIIRAYPGLFCDFFSNGDYVVSDGTQIQFLDKNDQVLWTKKLHVHHQLKISRDEKRILFISSDFEKANGRWDRWDHLYILNPQGEALASASLKELLPQIAETEPHVLAGEWEEATDWVSNFFTEPSRELFHTNSIYEIESSVENSLLPWLKTGNIIINLHRQKELFAILDPSLKKVLHVQSLDQIFARPTNTHDAQILPNGNLLIYVNKTKLPSGHSPSSLAEVDLASKKITWQYHANPPENFASPLRGGVSRLADGNYLFNDETTGAGRMIWINQQGRILKLLDVPFLDPETKRPAIIQEVKMKSLTDFLKNSRP